MAIDETMADYWRKWRSYRRDYQPKAAESGGVLPPLPSVSIQQPATPGPQPAVPTIQFPPAAAKPQTQGSTYKHWSAPIGGIGVDPVASAAAEAAQQAAADAQAQPTGIQSVYDVTPLNLYWQDVANQRTIEANREQMRDSLLQMLLGSLAPGAWRMADVGQDYWKQRRDQEVGRLNRIIQGKRQRIEEMYQRGQISAASYRRMLEDLELQRAMQAESIQERLAAEREAMAMQWGAHRTQALQGVYAAIPRDRLAIPYPRVFPPENEMANIRFLPGSGKGGGKLDKEGLYKTITSMFPGVGNIGDLSDDDWVALMNANLSATEREFLRNIYDKTHHGQTLAKNPMTGQWEPIPVGHRQGIMM